MLNTSTRQSRASSAEAAPDGPALPLVNSEPTPSITVFFQAWIWLACTPYRLDSSATVLSSRTTANATFALKSTPRFLRTFAIRPELTKRPPGTHKQTYQERIGGLSAEIRQKMSVALFALLMTALTGITCFPHTPDRDQIGLKNQGII
jgi:hypothetical protein